MVEAVAVEAVAPGERVSEPVLAVRDGGGPEAVAIVALWSGGAEHQAPVFERTALLAGDRLAGPTLIREANATTVVEPGWTAEVTGLNHLVLRSSPHRAASRASAPHPGPLPEGEGADKGEGVDPVLLELFNNLFTNVAEQTGVVLANTSLSVNIKERLDFSCAIFDAEGRLVAKRAACSGASGRHGAERAHGAGTPRGGRCGRGTWWR